jgi:multiple sugar transport system substrate-binding protein
MHRPKTFDGVKLNSRGKMNMNRWKMLTLLLALTLVLGGLSACGGNSETNSVDEGSNVNEDSHVNEDSNDEVTQKTPEDFEGDLEIWTFFGQVEAMAEAFEEKYPNVTVNVKVFPGDQYQTKLMTAIQTQTDVPDIFDLERGYIGNFIDQPFLADLSAMGAEDLVENYVPYVAELGKDENGVIRAVSDHSSPGGYWYHRAEAKEYLGTDDPDELSEMFSSWENIIELGKKVQEDSNGEVHLISHMGDVFNVEKYQQEPWIQDGALVIDPAWDDVINNMREIRESGVDAKYGFFSPGWGNAINEGGDVIMFAMPAWAGFMVNNDEGRAEGKYGIAHAPKGYYMGGTYRAIFEGGENKELAYEFVKYIASPEWQERNLEATGNMPGNGEVYENQKDSFTHKYFGDQNILEVYHDIVNDIPAHRPHANDDNIAGTFYDKVSEGIENGKSNEEIINAFKKEIRNSYPTLIVE